MVTLEQVEQLDERVRKVISLIEALRHENARLFSENRRLLEENQRLEYHLQESERRSLALSGAQELLEKGLMGAIDRLDSVSHEVMTSEESPAGSLSPGQRRQDDPNAGLAELLVRDPAVDELADDAEGSESSNSDHVSRQEERKMDIF